MTSVANDTLGPPVGNAAWAKRHGPVLALAAVLLVLPLLLVATIPQPMGALMWDLYIYLDTTNRIAGGQIPSVDFFAPVGALGYYLFAGVSRLFPNGHPLLISAWSLLLVSAPLMAVILIDVQRRSIALAVALLVPFLFYSLLPFNVGSIYPYPGAEGFGIYNRQVCQLLYVLAAALVFLEGPRKLGACLAITMLALFFIKVTGLVAGALMCVMALSAGRFSLRIAITAGAAFCAVLAVVELTTGMVTAYIGDILALLQVNNDTLLPRLLKAASMNIGAVLATVGLSGALVLSNRELIRARLAAVTASPSWQTVSHLADLPFVWISVFLVAGLFFESQNTGSQSLIFLWPLLLNVILDQYRRDRSTPRAGLVAILALAVALPPAIEVVQKASRAWVGMLDSVRLDHQHLKTIGAFAVKPVFSERAARLETIYIDHRATYEALAEAEEPASFLVFSDFDFQWSWLQSADRAVTAMLAYEARYGVRFETVMTIDFVNPFAWLMDRQAPRYIAIGADPTRSVPVPGAPEIGAIQAVDIALVPTCPVTPTRTSLLALYAPVLAGTHTRIPLTPCYDAFIRNALAPR